MDTAQDLKTMTEDLKKANAGVDRIIAERDRMREALLWLHHRGGLGHDAHGRIAVALGAPYPFCRHVEKCAGKGYCPRDIACND
jgi:hypothetical protein